MKFSCPTPRVGPPEDRIFGVPHINSSMERNDDQFSVWGKKRMNMEGGKFECLMKDVDSL